MAPAPPRLDRRQAANLYERSRAATWGVSRDQFFAALTASLAHAFRGIHPTTAEVEAYADGLHVEDLALAVACAGGSEAAWEHFVAEYRPLLHRSADAIDATGGARELADGLYGELYGMTERDGSRRSLFRYFHGRSRLSTWLRAVLAQRHVDRIRTVRRDEPLPDDPSRIAAPASAGPAGAERDRFQAAVGQALEAAIAALAPRDRLRLSCYYAQDMTLAAIGRLLKEHEATVSRGLAKTRAALRAAIEERLARDHGLDQTAIDECVRTVADDAGAMDVGQLLGGAVVRKKVLVDRSRE